MLLADDGLIGYELHRQDHAVPRSGVTLLPPNVVHDGHPVTAHGFRKRVKYLEEQVLDEALIGAAVDAPLVEDRGLLEQVSRLDRALVRGHDREAESRLVLVAERLSATKVALAVRADLESWQRLNVTAFLVSASAADLSAARARAVNRGIPLAVYTRHLHP